jgi:tetratricopeptide (TPR) repeat protein
LFHIVCIVVEQNAWKRKVALCKGEGDISSAIVELNRYLEVFQIDNDAWQELLDLYVAQRKFDLAKFVAEELIAAAPENYLNHLQYADILYTIGGRENVEMASVYYSQSLELNSTQNNLRAFYGTILVYFLYFVRVQIIPIRLIFELFLSVRSHFECQRYTVDAT